MTFGEAWLKLGVIVYTDGGQPDAVLAALSCKMDNLGTGWTEGTSGSRAEGHVCCSKTRLGRVRAFPFHPNARSRGPLVRGG